ncbi:MAG: LTA synthase family protein [Rubrobacter sp.]|nr:LTA synthase family protein [Rubrobacter sp.]
MSRSVLYFGLFLMVFLCLVIGAVGLGRVFFDWGIPAASEPRLQSRPISESGFEQRPNVVTIELESVGARAVGAYNEEARATPYLDSLAEDSLLAERAYTTIPHTGKALVSSNCGVYPPPHTLSSEAHEDAVPVPCLAELLGEQGYETMHFGPAKAPNPPNLAGGGSHLMANFGFSEDEIYPKKEIPTEGFEEANYFSYEDATMLEPSREWLQNAGHSERPFYASYKTSTPHHPYNAPARYGQRDYSQAAGDEEYNRYLNSVHYVDQFLEELIGQYKDLGLYENTIFVIYADHGEAFGEHEVGGKELAQHDQVLYQEGARVPLMVHAPGSEKEQGRVGRLASIMDILPTVADLAGYRLEGAEQYRGESLLPYRPFWSRTLYLSCWPPGNCSGALRASSTDPEGEKYIYRFGKAPEEYYDLSSDPTEERDLLAAGGESARDSAQGLYEDTSEWFSSVVSRYERSSNSTGDE